MTTWAQVAEKQGIPLRTLDQVREDLARSKEYDGGDIALARIMLRHGRLAQDAREYVAREYPQ